MSFKLYVNMSFYLYTNMKGNCYSMLFYIKKNAKRFEVLPLLYTATMKNRNFKVQLYIINSGVTDNYFKAFC